MSKYCGKADLCDSIMIDLDSGTSWDTIVKSYHLSKHNRDGTVTEIPISCKEDFIQYYPYIIISGAWSKENGSHLMLSSESYVDFENRERIKIYIEMFKRDFDKRKRRCKREHKEFDLYEYATEWVNDTSKHWGKLDAACVDAITQAIDNNFELDKIKYGYTNMAKYYRNLLRQEMLDNGLDPEKYGY